MPSEVPRSRPNAHVYRVRRALLASGLVIVAGLVSSVVKPNSASDPRPTTTSTTQPVAAAADPPPCAEGDVPTTQDPARDWATILIDTEIALPAGYGPSDLHNISEAGFPLTEGVAVRALVMDDLRALREAAAANGTPISILDGYRSYPRQVELFERRGAGPSHYETGSRVVRPGHSEHQLGTVIDVVDEGAATVDPSWGASPAGQWIASNGHEYGFILSYPTDSFERVCYQAEPWHLRYVGRDQATAIIESGLTAREYFWRLLHGEAPQPTA